MTFGAKLKELRQNNGLTQSELAIKLDTSKSNISKYESNSIEPNIKTLLLISKYFQIPIDELLAEETMNIPSSLSSNGQHFCKILSHLRKEKGISQHELAKYIGISREAITNLEINKRKPDMEILIKLADYFDVSTDFLLGRIPADSKFDTAALTAEEQDILNYYHQLSLTNQRWIMGQMIDLIKRSEENDSESKKAMGK